MNYRNLISILSNHVLCEQSDMLSLLQIALVIQLRASGLTQWKIYKATYGT